MSGKPKQPNPQQSSSNLAATKPTKYSSASYSGGGDSWGSHDGMAYKSEKGYVTDYSLGKRTSYERMRSGQK